jgi:carboxymethylenebutenolidase
VPYELCKIARGASHAVAWCVTSPATGFRAALAFYPGCGLHARFDQGYRPYAPVLLLHGAADEETSPRRCAALADKSRALGGTIEIVLYPGASHDFDDPGKRRQEVAANAAAKADAIARALAFVKAALERR